ncbi:hypothetical protein JOD54_004364 [Actinokineospora baliensis]|uniref:hypothetical protein n=1 Tax=Actinokineospora baliensis TaxID=547056 RepID=UPI0019584F4A|nr:hypothetical protein [Actinokineospora baliensis]MBM7774160.1 hypothetical protein [Actinokineospora baliensis]
MARPVATVVTVTTLLLALLTTTVVTTSATATAATDSLRPSVSRSLQLLRSSTLNKLIKLLISKRPQPQDEGILGEGDAHMAEDGTDYP